MATSVSWPRDVDISFLRGMVLLVVLFLVPHLVLDASFRMGFPNNVATVKHSIEMVLIYTVVLAIVLVTLKLVGQISIVPFLQVKTLLPSELLVCVSFAALFGFFQFYASVPYGRLLPDVDYILFFLAGLLVHSVLWPLIEEVIFRGIAFVALFNYSKSRLTAYLGSTFLFTIFHTPSLPNLFLHATTGLSNAHLILIVSFSFFAAFIYERTGKLMLCVLAHGVVNGMEFLGVVVGYIVDFPLPEDWPGN